MPDLHYVYSLWLPPFITILLLYAFYICIPREHPIISDFSRLRRKKEERGAFFAPFADYNFSRARWIRGLGNSSG